VPTPPDFSKRGNPEQRILAIGHWGTYKRLETLMEAFPLILEKAPNAKLIVAGANHHTRAGYWESIRDSQPKHLPIEFLGYVAEDDIPELFQSTSVLVLPYDSATGSSGPAHQACEYGVPIVCADIPDFRGMVTDEGMAVRFYKTGSARDLADQIARILRSPDLEHRMAEQNFATGIQMTMTNVIQSYLRWFRLHKAKRAISETGTKSRSSWQDGRFSPDGSPRWNLGSGLFVGHDDGAVPHLVSQESDEFIAFEEADESFRGAANASEEFEL
jgi:glycosyltransferase involved in cell wall biosynthesis